MKVTIAVHKASPSASVGVRLVQGAVDGEVTVESLATDSPLAALQPGMIIVSVNDALCLGKSVKEIQALLAAVPRDLTIVATMPCQHVILKKDVDHDRLSFHGAHMTADMVNYIQVKWDALPRVKAATSRLLLSRHYDHSYRATMTREYQKHHEEDAIAAVFDAMANMGWDFKFQYDSHTKNSSGSRQEMFVFTK